MTSQNNSNIKNSSPIEVSPERRERMINRILEILSNGNNVQIKRRANGVIAVMEIKANTCDI